MTNGGNWHRLDKENRAKVIKAKGYLCRRRCQQ